MGDLKVGLNTTVGMAGALIASAFGGWDAAMTTLVIFMAIDYGSGLVVAGVFKKSGKSESGALSISAGWKGLCKKGVMLLVVLVAYRLDLVVGTSLIKDGTVIAFIANEAVSIIENAGLMGVPMPKIIQKAIDVLRNKGDDDDEL